MTIYVVRIEWKDCMTDEYKSHGSHTGFKDRERAERFAEPFNSEYSRAFVEEVEMLE